MIVKNKELRLYLNYNRFKSAAVEFFLDLLQDLTKMMDGDAALGSEPNRVDELNEIENKALRKLLLMEFELENTMRRVRKRMMIVRLISLLSGR